MCVCVVRLVVVGDRWGVQVVPIDRVTLAAEKAVALALFPTCEVTKRIERSSDQQAYHQHCKFLEMFSHSPVVKPVVKLGNQEVLLD